ncbi:MAG: hypothetical protein ACRD1Z_01760, partial [Vicinamibacteria bacterium]
MVTFWEVLGIDPTTDRRVIKKAYAARLKEFHPEDDPEGFAIVRSAYEAARSWAADQGAEVADDASQEEEPRKLERKMEALEASFDARLNEPESAPPKKVRRRRRAGSTLPKFFLRTARQKREREEEVVQAVDALMKRVRRLETRPDELNSERGWAPLLEGEVLWDLDLKCAFQWALLEYLGSRRPELPHGVWRLLDQRFRWVENAKELHRTHDASVVDWVLAQIHEARRHRPARRATTRPIP